MQGSVARGEAVLGRATTGDELLAARHTRDRKHRMSALRDPPARHDPAIERRAVADDDEPIRSAPRMIRPIRRAMLFLVVVRIPHPEP